jgi:hypothetical protein
MTTLTTIQTRTVQVLRDENNTRFPLTLLEEAARIALDTFDQRLPRVVSNELTVSTDGRDQIFSVPEECLYLVNIRFKQSRGPELEPGTGFTYQLEGGELFIHFSGRRIPRAGEVLRVSYAARYTLEGLDSAEATTIPESCESALVTGTAGHACLLRATGLIEAYGPRSTDITRWMEAGRTYLRQFSQVLGMLKVLQEFGYPTGFALDEEDRQGRRGF